MYVYFVPNIRKGWSQGESDRMAPIKPSSWSEWRSHRVSSESGGSDMTSQKSLIVSNGLLGNNKVKLFSLSDREITLVRPESFVTVHTTYCEGNDLYSITLLILEVFWFKSVLLAKFYINDKYNWKCPKLTPEHLDDQQLICEGVLMGCENTAITV